jgi:hypothetical protein
MTVMDKLIFTQKNSMDSAIKGYQLIAVAVSANGWQFGVGEAFRAIVDSGAFYTVIGETIMQKILHSVFDEYNKPLQPCGTVKTGGAFGGNVELPRYIIPHIYFGSMHFTNVSVLMSNNDNFQCLLGRSILNSCILTLNPELNNMKFEFTSNLSSRKESFDGVLPFEEVSQYASF